MIVPLVMLVISGAGVVLAVLLSGWADLVLVAGPAALASLFLLVRAWRVPAVAVPKVRGFRFGRQKPERVMLIDGSNVLHWRDNAPNLDTLQAVIAEVMARGYAPAVVFDANAGYLVAGRYLHDKALGDLLGLAEDRVMVVPKGEPADPVLLTAAGEMQARIVTNDRYRDWAERFPRLGEPGFLVRGGWRDGGVWVETFEMAVV